MQHNTIKYNAISPPGPGKEPALGFGSGQEAPAAAALPTLLLILLCCKCAAADPTLLLLFLYNSY